MNGTAARPQKQSFQEVVSSVSVNAAEEINRQPITDVFDIWSDLEVSTIW